MLNREGRVEVKMATTKSAELLTFTQHSRSAPPMVNWKQSLRYKVNGTQVLLCQKEFVKKSAPFHMIAKKNTTDSNARGLTYFYGTTHSRANKEL